ncbi:secondary thiamine-phosphate synthase enzyme YjbQ [soil metagenome]
MIIEQTSITIATRGARLYDVTAEVAAAIRGWKIARGICNVFVRHTSASLLIQENADPAVLRDLQKWIARVAPESDVYEHDDEGPDDMPAHLRSAITKTQESIPIRESRLGLGTWQALYLWEHRAAAHQRELILTAFGET